jgi:thiamine biosynthesis lipoprotein
MWRIRRIVQVQETNMKTTIPIAIVLLACVSSSALHAEEPLKISGKTMGSYYAIVIDSPGSADGERLQKEIEEKFAEINRQMSTWDESSQISKFNQSKSTEWFEVGTDFAVVAQEAKRLHEVTQGAMDVTVSPLVDLWGFGKNKRRKLPTEKEIAAALKFVGMQHVEVRLDPPAIRKDLPEIQVSFSALAPGYAADEVCEILRSHQMKSYVVDVGGENRAGEAKASGDAWRLGVESPLGGLHKVVELTNQSIATSGDYRSFFMAGGKKYSHVLNPKTGRPVEHPPASVSVIHESCMTADGLATAMMVLGPEKGIELAKTVGVDVMFLDLTKDGMLTEQSIGVFAAEQASPTKNP